jgi:hypothetical protein
MPNNVLSIVAAVIVAEPVNSVVLLVVAQLIKSVALKTANKSAVILIPVL